MGEYDVILVADMVAGSEDASSVADALERWASGGVKICLSPAGRPATENVAPLSVEIVKHLDRGHAELVLPHEQVRAQAIVIWSASRLAPASLPGATVDRVFIVSDELVGGEGSINGDGLLFGHRPAWRREPPELADLTGSRHSGGSKEDRGRREMQQSVAQTVLMVSSNGTGMGHLTRLLSYVRKAPPGVRPHFLSLSQAVPAVGEFGFPYEYVASVAATGMSPGRWRKYFASRLGEAIERLRPPVAVFDGAWAYESIADVKALFPEVRWVWSRRGMWYRGRNRDQLAKAAWFDTVVEPGDFSSPADRGVTTTAPASRVGPVTILDTNELLSRADARQALGLDAVAPTALVTLGAGNINDTTSAVRVVIDALQSLGVEVCVTMPAIAERTRTDDTRVRAVTTYPLAKYLRAFDLAVSAAGYNSFHELLRFGVPTLFLPNLNTALDDQRARAAYAAKQGWALSLERADSASQVRTSLEALLQGGSGMVARVAELDPGNGAGHAMELIAGHAREVS